MKLVSTLKVKRNELSSRSRERCFGWVNNVDALQCKNICDGAIKAGYINPVTEKSPDKVIEKSILSPKQRFCDEIYVRTYQPEYIKRV